MTLCGEVKVGYKHYKVKEEQNLHESEAELQGQIRYLEQEIALREDITEESKEATLMHECLHAIDEMYGIELSEEQVERLGNALYMFIEDNPQMFRGE
jgi:hypothetical protein|nr:MAG TPA: llama Aa1 VHH domain, Botulinum, VHH, antibody, botulinum, neurotoxin.6A [Caudoviricetes sp.]